MKDFLLLDTPEIFSRFSFFSFSSLWPSLVILSLETQGEMMNIFHSLRKRKCLRQDSRPDPRQTQGEDESIQAFVFEKAKRLGYGLRIIPRVKEILFGRSSTGSNKVKSPTGSKNARPTGSNTVREKRKLRDPRRPPRLTSHVSPTLSTSRIWIFI